MSLTNLVSYRRSGERKENYAPRSSVNGTGRHVNFSQAPVRHWYFMEAHQTSTPSRAATAARSGRALQGTEPGNDHYWREASTRSWRRQEGRAGPGLGRAQVSALPKELLGFHLWISGPVLTAQSPNGGNEEERGSSGTAHPSRWMRLRQLSAMTRSTLLYCIGCLTPAERKAEKDLSIL